MTHFPTNLIKSNCIRSFRSYVFKILKNPSVLFSLSPQQPTLQSSQKINHDIDHIIHHFVNNNDGISNNDDTITEYYDSTCEWFCNAVGSYITNDDSWVVIIIICRPSVFRSSRPTATTTTTNTNESLYVGGQGR